MSALSPVTIAFLLFPNITQLDLTGPAQVLSRLSQFAAQAGPRLRSVDLNPVFAMPEGQGAWAADAVLEVQEVADGAES